MDNLNNTEELGIIAKTIDIMNLDNSVDKNQKTKIITGKAKILTINVDEEWIENSFIDLPFIYYYKTKEPVYMVEYKWNSNDGLERAIQVRSSIYGVPTPFEYDVLLALLRIYIRNNDDKIIIGKQMNNTIYFTFRELNKEMGFKGFGSVNKKKLERSVEILCDTNIYNTAKGGLYNTKTKEYITDAKMGIGILHNYSGYSYKNTKDGIKLDKSSLKDKASVVIDSFFLQNIISGKGKISNGTLRKSLKIDVAKRLYLIINKWKNNRKEMYITYNKLYERIPLNGNKTVSYRNARIRTACKELVKTNFLYDFEAKKQGINFIFTKKQKCNSSNTTPNFLESSPNTTPLKNKYSTYSELYEGFKKYKFTEEEIDEYLKLDQIPLAQCILRYVDANIKRIKKEPKYYIIGCLIKNKADLLQNQKYNNKCGI